jgi:RimJ/RimL family protein N-acetyltransferase
MNILQNTPDLRLRPVELPADIQLALPWYADPEVMDLSEGISEPYGEDTIGGMYRFFLARGEAFIIEVRDETGDWLAIGDAALTPETVPVVIGVPEYRSRGLGRRVLALIIEHAREQGWAKLKTKGIWTRNPRSRRAFEAVGFKLVETGPDNEGRESWFHELDLGADPAASQR